MKAHTLIATLLLAILLTSCSSDDDDETGSGAVENDASDDASVDMPADTDDDPSSGEESGMGDRPDTSDIAGLWDSRIQTSEGVDEVFTLIESDGIISEYDYRQDEVGSGENCYDIVGFGLEPRGDDVYAIGNQSYTMIRTEQGLSVEFVDVDDVDRDGDTEETLQQVWPPVEGIDEADLPSCGI